MIFDCFDFIMDILFFFFVWVWYFLFDFLELCKVGFILFFLGGVLYSIVVVVWIIVVNICEFLGIEWIWIIIRLSLLCVLLFLFKVMF